MSGSSNSVRVQFSADQCPATFGAAHALLGVYGDIARLDVTLVSATGFVLATYFDVRAADRVLAGFGAHAEAFPASAHDFRAVTVSAETISTLSGSFSGFQSFGEVMGVSLDGEDMVVEYFDMRAAHAVLLSLPTSKPRHQEGGRMEEAGFPMLRQASPGGGSSSGGGSSLGGGSPLAVPGIESRSSESRSSARGPAFGGGTEEPAWELAAAVGDRRGAASAEGRRERGGKAVRAKADGKDLAKFEIEADKITSGTDSRTTVMMRNIPKTCSREDVAQLLARCGLQDRYTFFYMPFDKRRSVLCGFAFLNFISPGDVLQLHTSAQTSLWRTLSSGTNAMPPAVSYARLQGHQELVKHFSLSAITYDKDVRKRPQFMQGEDGHVDVKLSEKKPSASVDPSSMQPRYVFPVGSGPSARAVCAGHEDFDWLQSGAAGA